MKVIHIPSVKEMTVTEEPIPAVQPGEVLVKLAYVGFCGSDLNTFLGRNAMAKENVIPGTRSARPSRPSGRESPNPSRSAT